MLLPRSALVAVLTVCLFSPRFAAAQNCRVSYSSNPRRPLLFGGVVESCTGFRCQNRNDFYAKKCGGTDGSTWGVCTNTQAQAVIGMLFGHTFIAAPTICCRGWPTVIASSVQGLSDQTSLIRAAPEGLSAALGAAAAAAA